MCLIVANVTDSTNTMVNTPPGGPQVFSDPIVSAGPALITIDYDQNATFFATVARGTGSFAYQWHNESNGNSPLGPLSLSNSITIKGSAPGTFKYLVNVTDTGTTPNGLETLHNYSGSEFNVSYTAATPTIYNISGSVELIVKPPLSGNIYPANPVIDSGQHITLYANVQGGTPPYTYQWYTASSQSLCTTSDTAISGATSNTYVASPTFSTYYCFIAKDSAATSASISTVTDLVTVDPVPVLTALPQNAEIDQGQSLTFNTGVSGGTGTFTYLWYNDSTGTPEPILYEQLPTFFMTGGKTGNFVYYVTATDTGTTPGAAPQISAVSNNALLEVMPYPTVNIIPSYSKINVTNSTSLFANVSGGTGNFAYQWYNATSGPGIAISGATSNSLGFYGSATGNYIYYVIVTDLGTYTGALPIVTALSQKAAIEVEAKPKVYVTLLPPNAVIDAGQSVSFTNTTTGGTPPYTYVYSVNAVSANTYANNAIENGNSFNFAEAGLYNITLSANDINGVSGSASSLVSVNPKLNVSISPVYSTLVLNTSQSRHFIHCEKSNTLYTNGVEDEFHKDECQCENSTIYTSNVMLNSSVLGGTPPYAYQWYNVTTGTPIAISGATQNTYTVYAGALGLFRYNLKVTDDVASTAISNNATVQVCTNKDSEWSSNAGANVSLISSASITLSGNTFKLSIAVLNDMAKCTIVLKHVQISGMFNVSEDGSESVGERTFNFLLLENGTLSLPRESRSREGPNGYRLNAGNPEVLSFNGTLYNGNEDEAAYFIPGQQYIIKLNGEEDVSSVINVTAEEASSGPYVYIANAGSNNVVIVNAAANKAIGAITAGFNGPQQIAISPDSSYAYVANWGSNSISIISTAADAVVNTILNGFFAPVGVAISPDGAYAYAVNYHANNTVIINTATNTVVGAITSGINYPGGVAFSPAGTYAYVANYYNVLILNTATNTITGSIPGFSLPWGIAFSPGGAYAYITNAESNNVVIVNTATNTVVGALTQGFSDPTAVAFSPDGAYAYVTNYNANNVVIVNTATNTVVGALTQGFDEPDGIAFLSP